MNDWEEYIYHYRRLLAHMDADGGEISRCFQGELLDAYRQLLKKEQDALVENLKKLY